MTETLACVYSSESTQRELSNEYQHDRVSMVFKNLCLRVLWTTVALALKGLKQYSLQILHLSLLTISCLEIILTSVVWTYHTLKNSIDEQFSKYFLNIAFIRERSLNKSGGFGYYRHECVNPYAADGYFGPNKIMQKKT